MSMSVRVASWTGAGEIKGGPISAANFLPWRVIIWCVTWPPGCFGASRLVMWREDYSADLTADLTGGVKGDYGPCCVFWWCLDWIINTSHRCIYTVVTASKRRSDRHTAIGVRTMILRKKKVLPKKIPPFKMGRNWYLFDENGLAVSMMLVLFYLSWYWIH